jgi:hypothetical protein
MCSAGSARHSSGRTILQSPTNVSGLQSISAAYNITAEIIAAGSLFDSKRKAVRIYNLQRIRIHQSLLIQISKKEITYHIPLHIVGTDVLCRLLDR